jgi:hypothetical protein
MTDAIPETPPTDEQIMSPEFQEKIQENAKKTFSLKDRLQGRTARVGKITVFLNQMNLMRANAMNDTLQRLTDERAKPGVNAARQQELLEEYNALEERYLKIIDDLNADSLVIHLQSIPRIAIDRMERKVIKRYANINKGKTDPAEMMTPEEIEFDSRKAMEQGQITLAVQRIEDADGALADLGQGTDVGFTLMSLLSPNEAARLFNTVQQMIFGDDVGRFATDDAGF